MNKLTSHQHLKYWEKYTVWLKQWFWDVGSKVSRCRITLLHTQVQLSLSLETRQHEKGKCYIFFLNRRLTSDVYKNIRIHRFLFVVSAAQQMAGLLTTLCSDVKTLWSHKHESRNTDHWSRFYGRKNSRIYRCFIFYTDLTQKRQRDTDRDHRPRRTSLGWHGEVIAQRR